MRAANAIQLSLNLLLCKTGKKTKLLFIEKEQVTSLSEIPSAFTRSNFASVNESWKVRVYYLDQSTCYGLSRSVRPYVELRLHLRTAMVYKSRIYSVRVRPPGGSVRVSLYGDHIAQGLIQHITVQTQTLESSTDKSTQCLLLLLHSEETPSAASLTHTPSHYISYKGIKIYKWCDAYCVVYRDGMYIGERIQIFWRDITNQF
jgi:hypothetical protein